MAEHNAQNAVSDPIEGRTTRRDFLYIATGAMAGVGALAATWPLIDQMNPARDAKAPSAEGIDISVIQPGQTKTTMWRGTPIFIRARTPEEIDAARNTPVDDLWYPEADQDRVIRDPWLVVVGLCTYAWRCVLHGTKGAFDGWFCVCCASHYDTSGRIRKGVARKNMLVPRYAFLDDATIRIDGLDRPKLNCCSDLLPEYLGPLRATN